MKILVTGGFGFIGSNFVNMIRSETSHEVIILDKMTYAADIKNVHKNIIQQNYYVDIRSAEDVERVFKVHKFNYIVNFAAESHVDNSIENPNIFFETNILGSVNIMNMARKYNIPMIQVSTDEVYGSVELGESNESYPIQPNSPYSASKASADMIAKSFIETYRQNIIITRCCNNYGPNQHAEKLIPKIVHNLKNDIAIPVYGTGKNIREWIHVYDHCKAIYHLMENGVAGEVYNVGSNERMSNIDIIIRISKILDKEPRLKFVEDRKGHDLRYALNSVKLYQSGWRKKYDINEGLKSFI